jgi:hypothetical protein
MTTSHKHWPITHNWADCPDTRICAAHRRVSAPEIPIEARPHVIAYLRWLGNDEGDHGGLWCRGDRNLMIEHAERLAALPEEGKS